jgi:hypothetical protein
VTPKQEELFRKMKKWVLFFYFFIFLIPTFFCWIFIFFWTFFSITIKNHFGLNLQLNHHNIPSTFYILVFLLSAMFLYSKSITIMVFCFFSQNRFWGPLFPSKPSPPSSTNPYRFYIYHSNPRVYITPST